MKISVVQQLVLHIACLQSLLVVVVGGGGGFKARRVWKAMDVSEHLAVETDPHARGARRLAHVRTLGWLSFQLLVDLRRWLELSDDATHRTNVETRNHRLLPSVDADGAAAVSIDTDDRLTQDPPAKSHQMHFVEAANMATMLVYVICMTVTGVLHLDMTAS